MPEALVPAHLVAAKAVATPDPSNTESIFFHRNGLVIGCDSERPIGTHWRVIGQMPPEIVNKPIKWACTIPELRCILIGQFGADGTSNLRLYRGA
jgi:hypothetical protein